SSRRRHTRWPRDWSSDVCSSDLQEVQQQEPGNADKAYAEREKDVLRGLIDQDLLLDKGKDLGITADTDLIKRLDEIRKQMNLESMEDLEKAAQVQIGRAHV